jgi:hypothetical protein
MGDSASELGSRPSRLSIDVAPSSASRAEEEGVAVVVPAGAFTVLASLLPAAVVTLAIDEVRLAKRRPSVSS